MISAVLAAAALQAISADAPVELAIKCEMSSTQILGGELTIHRQRSIEPYGADRWFVQVGHEAPVEAKPFVPTLIATDNWGGTLALGWTSRNAKRATAQIIWSSVNISGRPAHGTLQSTIGMAHHSGTCTSASDEHPSMRLPE